MYTCPHCQHKTARFSAKWLSSRVLPITCSQCQGLSHAPGSPGNLLMVVSAVVLTLAGFASVYCLSAGPLAGSAAALLALWAARLHAQPLLALSPQQVAQARQAEGMGFLALALVSWMRIAS